MQDDYVKSFLYGFRVDDDIWLGAFAEDIDGVWLFTDGSDPAYLQEKMYNESFVGYAYIDSTAGIVGSNEVFSETKRYVCKLSLETQNPLGQSKDGLTGCFSLAHDLRHPGICILSQRVVNWFDPSSDNYLSLDFFPESAFNSSGVFRTFFRSGVERSEYLPRRTNLDCSRGGTYGDAVIWSDKTRAMYLSMGHEARRSFPPAVAGCTLDQDVRYQPVSPQTDLIVAFKNVRTVYECRYLCGNEDVCDFFVYDTMRAADSVCHLYQNYGSRTTDVKGYVSGFRCDRVRRGADIIPFSALTSSKWGVWSEHFATDLENAPQFGYFCACGAQSVTVAAQIDSRSSTRSSSVYTRHSHRDCFQNFPALASEEALHGPLNNQSPNSCKTLCDLHKADCFAFSFERSSRTCHFVKTAITHRLMPRRHVDCFIRLPETSCGVPVLGQRWIGANEESAAQNDVTSIVDIFQGRESSQYYPEYDPNSFTDAYNPFDAQRRKSIALKSATNLDRSVIISTNVEKDSVEPAQIRDTISIAEEPVWHLVFRQTYDSTHGQNDEISYDFGEVGSSCGSAEDNYIGVWEECEAAASALGVPLSPGTERIIANSSHTHVLVSNGLVNHDYTNVVQVDSTHCNGYDRVSQSLLCKGTLHLNTNLISENSTEIGIRNFELEVGMSVAALPHGYTTIEIWYDLSIQLLFFLKIHILLDQLDLVVTRVFLLSDDYQVVICR